VAFSAFGGYMRQLTKDLSNNQMDYVVKACMPNVGSKTIYAMAYEDLYKKYNNEDMARLTPPKKGIRARVKRALSLG